MKHKILKSLSLVIASLLSVAIFSVVPVSAAVYDFGVSPIVQRLELDPGETYKGTFKVLNNNDSPAKYTLKVTPYQLTGEDFTDPDYDTVNRYTQISQWVTFSKDKGTIPANSSTEVKYTIRVPQNASADGQYAVLMAETIPESFDGSGVNTVYDVGMLVYAKVAGETNECGKILSNTTNTFLLESKISASATVENCGNVHTDVKHTLQVFPIFSDEEIYTNEEDPEQNTVLPETKRFITSSWDNAPAFGLFKVKHTVTIFGETNTINKVVLICPIWLTIIFIALFITIIFWAASNRRQRKAAKANRLATSGVKTEKDKKD